MAVPVRGMLTIFAPTLSLKQMQPHTLLTNKSFAADEGKNCRHAIIILGMWFIRLIRIMAICGESCSMPVNTKCAISRTSGWLNDLDTWWGEEGRKCRNAKQEVNSRNSMFFFVSGNVVYCLQVIINCLRLASPLNQVTWLSVPVLPVQMLFFLSNCSFMASYIWYCFATTWYYLRAISVSKCWNMFIINVTF